MENLEGFSGTLVLFRLFDPLLREIHSFVIIIEKVVFRRIGGLLKKEILAQETEKHLCFS